MQERFSELLRILSTITRSKIPRPAGKQSRPLSAEIASPSFQRSRNDYLWPPVTECVRRLLIEVGLPGNRQSYLD
jgi:hypothetical protein